MAKAYTGGCACGAIRYEISGEPAMAGHCQCRDCQKTTGAGHASVLAFPEASFKITGKAKFYEVKADSGKMAGRGFCPNCGSILFDRPGSFPGVMMVTAGTLDEPGRFQPQFVLFTSSGNAWDYMDPKLPKFQKMPPPG
jgi:hypothetical protein